MARRGRTAMMTILLIAATLTGFAIEGKLGFPSGDRGIWFTGGLLMLIVGCFWIEHFFTRPADVVVNGLTVFVSTSLLVDPPHALLWNLLRYGALVLSILAFSVIWFGDPSRAASGQKPIVRAVYVVVTRLGASKVQFTLVFFLALVSYFDLQSKESLWLATLWAIIVLTREIDPIAFIRLARSGGRGSALLVGRVSRYREPNIVRLQLDRDAVCRSGTVVSFSCMQGPKPDDPIGLITGSRRGVDSVESEAIVVEGTFQDGTIESRGYVFKLDAGNAEVEARLRASSIGGRWQDLVGFTASNTCVSRLQIELCGKNPLAVGELVTVPMLAGSPVLYQITDARLTMERSFEGNERLFTVAHADQLGKWNVEKGGFETHGWIAPENAPVLTVRSNADDEMAVPTHGITVGHIPNSSYPVRIVLDELVLYHSAILGVTGSGKSFLAFSLIEAVAAQGIKVLCLDITGDYKRYLSGAVMVKTTNMVKPFLEDQHKGIGIVEFTEDGRIHPIDAAKTIIDSAMRWAREHRTQEDIRVPRPKLLIVMEEAHVLVPEWNFGPKDKQQAVNEIAQQVLQSRKFGVGFMVVTQRTANVVKSVLNQCNTIFAFQAFDETGFDFLKNYLGDAYVRTLPSLGRRRGIVVGKASVCEPPVIARFLDQDRGVVEVELPTFSPAPANDDVCPPVMNDSSPAANA